MTISNPVNSMTAQGTGVTASFSYEFLLPTTASAVVQIYDTTVTPNTLTSLVTGSFTLTGVGSDAGGTIQYPLDGTFLSSGQYISLYRILPVVQETSIANQGRFAPQATENALDYQTMVSQQFATAITAIEAALGEPLPPVVQTAPVIPTASTTVSGLVTLSAHLTAIAGTNDTSAMTPLDVAYAVQHGGAFNYAADSSVTTNSMTATLVPAPITGSLANNFQCTIRPALTNTSTAVTLTLNAGTSYAVKKAGASGLIVLGIGDIVASVDACFLLSTTDNCQILQNPLTSTNAGMPGFVGLSIVNGAASTSITMSATYMTAVNSAGFLSPLGVSQSFTINCLTTGANGLDTGALANTSEYHCYAIYNPSTATWAGIASLNSTSPSSMPSGYTFWVRGGCMLTGGAASFLRTQQKGSKGNYVVTSGSTTTNLPQIVAPANSQTRTAATVRGTTGSGNCSKVPSTATRALIAVAVSNAANSAIGIAPSADTGYAATISLTNPPPFNAQMNTSPNTWVTTMIDLTFEGTTASTSASIYYSTGSGASTNTSINIYAWFDSVNAS